MVYYTKQHRTRFYMVHIQCCTVFTCLAKYSTCNQPFRVDANWQTYNVRTRTCRRIRSKSTNWTNWIEYWDAYETVFLRVFKPFHTHMYTYNQVSIHWQPINEITVHAFDVSVGKVYVYIVFPNQIFCVGFFFHSLYNVFKVRTMLIENCTFL